ncbi:hypothetical protein Skr01_06850 [Sphaerisporangium krabiense]|nr:hypothetical protein Skr01_06850 [Sphaerisporangium krabiense]
MRQQDWSPRPGTGARTRGNVFGHAGLRTRVTLGKPFAGVHNGSGPMAALKPGVRGGRAD